jgi:DNA-binding CsgD family transcriptional regulator
VLRQEVARLLVAEGRPADALAVLDATATPIPIANPARNPWRGVRAAALHGLGRTDEAVALAAEEVALLRTWGAPSYLGAALRHLGELTGDEGALREAVTVLAPTRCAVELAAARCALAVVPAVPDAEAGPLLRAADAAAWEAGAAPVHERARAELRRRGAPVDAAGTPVRRLTRTQRRVVDLSSEGLSVPEVAQRLFLTPAAVRAALEAAAGSLEPAP